METATMRLERRRMTIERKKKKGPPLHTCAVTQKHEKGIRVDVERSELFDENEVNHVFDPIPASAGAAF